MQRTYNTANLHDIAEFKARLNNRTALVVAGGHRSASLGGNPRHGRQITAKAVVTVILMHLGIGGRCCTILTRAAETAAFQTVAANTTASTEAHHRRGVSAPIGDMASRHAAQHPIEDIAKQLVNLSYL